MTGNIVRALEVDNDIGEVTNSQARRQHVLHQVIPQNYVRLEADHRITKAHTPPGTMPFERREVFAAWDEAVKARQPTNPQARPGDGWNADYLMERLPFYPVYFSVEGAITVTVPILVADLPGNASDTLQNFAFFEPADSQPSDDSSSIQLQLPLLLIRDQIKSNNRDGLDKYKIPPQYSTRNAQRIATASAAWYLAHLGIQDFPVFGLVTCGKKGYLSQAWVSKRDEVRSLIKASSHTNLVLLVLLRRRLEHSDRSVRHRVSRRRHRPI